MLEVSYNTQLATILQSQSNKNSNGTGTKTDMKTRGTEQKAQI
jgi:hypothetical protein